MSAQVIISAVIGACAVATPATESDALFINAANAAKETYPDLPPKKRRAPS
jgi:hypothetical protein